MSEDGILSVLNVSESVKESETMSDPTKNEKNHQRNKKRKS